MKNHTKSNTQSTDRSTEQSVSIIDENIEKLLVVDTDKLVANPLNPRHSPANEESQALIHNLEESLSSSGMIEPIIVTPNMVIIAGHRRFQAALAAGWTKVSVIVRDIDERTQLCTMLAENMQRENLTPIEEAEAFNNLRERFGMTLEEISKSVGKSVGLISNRIQLLKLPSDIKAHLNHGRINLNDVALVKTQSPQIASSIIEAKATRLSKRNKAVRYHDPKMTPEQHLNADIESALDHIVSAWNRLKAHPAQSGTCTKLRFIVDALNKELLGTAESAKKMPCVCRRIDGMLAVQPTCSIHGLKASPLLGSTLTNIE